jgi:hypothetical protein
MTAKEREEFSRELGRRVCDYIEPRLVQIISSNACVRTVFEVVIEAQCQQLLAERAGRESN